MKLAWLVVVLLLGAPTFIACSSDGSSSGGSSGTGGTGTGGTGTGGTGTGGTGTGGTGAVGVDCSQLPTGPFAAQLVPQISFTDGRDIAFDGLGHIAGRRDSEFVLYGADGTENVLADLPGLFHGLRFRANGDLLAAQATGEIIRITPEGATSDYVTHDLGGVSGLYPDLDGNVWYTRPTASIVGRINADLSNDELLTSAEVVSPKHVVYDPGRRVLYVSSAPGVVGHVVIDAQGNPGPMKLAMGGILQTPAALSLDVCGNLYVVDTNGGQIYRFATDAQGALIGEAKPLIDQPPSDILLSQQFGTGQGFSATSLYAISLTGAVYQIDVGVPGAPYPTPG